MIYYYITGCYCFQELLDIFQDFFDKNTFGTMACACLDTSRRRLASGRCSKAKMRTQFGALCAPSGFSRGARQQKKRTGALCAPLKIREFCLRRIFLLAALVSELPSPCSQNANPCVCFAYAVSINDTASKKEQEHYVLLFFFW